MAAIVDDSSFKNKFLQLKTSFRKNILQLKAKLFYNKDAPKTIIADSRYNKRQFERSTNVVYNSERKIKKVNLDVDNEAGLVTFFSFAYGPLYRSREQHRWKELKRHAWGRLQWMTYHLFGDMGSDVTHLYIDAVKNAAVDGGRSFYKQENHTDSLEEISTDDFIWMMVIDGCFFLQIALTLLGGSRLLNNDMSENGLFFGEPSVNSVSILKAAASSMFLVGNQIPLVVLRALMGQKFFKEVIHGGVWEQPLDLERLALFELLLVPAVMNFNVSDAKLPTDDEGHRFPIRIPTALFLDNQHVVCEIMDRSSVSRNSGLQASLTTSSQASSSQETSCLTIVWLIVKALCITAISTCIKDKDPPIEVDDLFNGLRLLLVGHMRPPGVLQIRSEGNIQDKSSVLLPAIPSATQLKEMGIVFRYSESTRISEISLKKVMFNASLYLPRIVIDFDNNIETLLKNLIRYEMMHLEESSWTVCEYLTFMRELIRSPEDVAVLTSSGVIVADPYQESRVPVLFRNLGIPRMKQYYCLRKVRDQLINYTRPSSYNKVRDVLTIVFLLGLIQTVFSVLAYFQQKA